MLIPSFSRYVQEEVQSIYKELNCFFAYSKEMFDSLKKEGVKYVRMGTLLCPKENYEAYKTRIEIVDTERRADYINQYGAINIILESLQNREYGYHENISLIKEDLEDFIKAYPLLFREKAFSKAIEKYWELESENL